MLSSGLRTSLNRGGAGSRWTTTRRRLPPSLSGLSRHAALALSSVKTIIKASSNKRSVRKGDVLAVTCFGCPSRSCTVRLLRRRTTISERAKPSAEKEEEFFLLLVLAPSPAYVTGRNKSESRAGIWFGHILVGGQSLILLADDAAGQVRVSQCHSRLRLRTVTRSSMRWPSADCRFSGTWYVPYAVMGPPGMRTWCLGRWMRSWRATALDTVPGNTG